MGAGGSGLMRRGARIALPLLALAGLAACQGITPSGGCGVSLSAQGFVAESARGTVPLDVQLGCDLRAAFGPDLAASRPGFPPPAAADDPITLPPPAADDQEAVE